jgi:adenylate cyclase class IV
VAGLGRFVEIEVMVTSGITQARRLMGELRRALGLRSADLIAGSYSDMLGKVG